MQPPPPSPRVLKNSSPSGVTGGTRFDFTSAAKRPRPFFVTLNGVQSLFFDKIFHPPTYVSQNDNHVTLIILTHVFWGGTVVDPKYFVLEFLCMCLG